MNKFLYQLSRPIISLYARGLLKLNVFQHAPLPEGPKILVANHPTTSDPFFVALMAKQPAHILIRANIFQVPLFGAYLRQLEHIPVVPGQGHKAFESAQQTLEAGCALILFPEGRLSPRRGGFRQPRTGAARLALSTGAPIIPIGIHLLREGIQYIKGKIGDELTVSRWPLCGPYTMTIGKAMYFEGDVEDHELVRTLSTHMMDCIIQLARQSQSTMQTASGALKAPTWNPSGF